MAYVVKRVKTALESQGEVETVMLDDGLYGLQLTSKSKYQTRAMLSKEAVGALITGFAKLLTGGGSPPESSWRVVTEREMELSVEKSVDPRYDNLVHVMVDLETLGKVAGCSVLSIGAVRLNPHNGKLGEEFYKVIRRNSCKLRDLKEDPETLKWWQDQSPNARKVLEQANDLEQSEDLYDVLTRFDQFLYEQCGGDYDLIRLYGNGADFDNPILQAAFNACGIKWKIKQGGRCYRSLKNLEELFPAKLSLPKIKRSGIHHNALDDAKDQARHLCELVSAVKEQFR